MYIPRHYFSGIYGNYLIKYVKEINDYKNHTYNKKDIL